MEKIQINDIIRFLRSAVQWAQSGGKLVEPEEAKRRAEICLTCPMNRGDAMRGSCPTCFAGRAVRFMADMIKDRELPPGLYYCAMCGCDLKLKVNFPIGTIDNAGLEYPEHCWQHGS